MSTKRTNDPFLISFVVLTHIRTIELYLVVYAKAIAVYALLITVAMLNNANGQLNDTDRTAVALEVAALLGEMSNDDVSWEFGPHGRIVMSMSPRLKKLAAQPESRELTRLFRDALADPSRFVAAHTILAIRCFQSSDCVCMKQSHEKYVVIFKGLKVDFSWRLSNGVTAKEVIYPASSNQRERLTEFWNRQFSFFRVRQIPLGTPRELNSDRENLKDATLALDEEELKQIEAALEQSVDVGISWHESGMVILPSLPRQAWQVLSSHPHAVRPLLLEMLHHPSKFVVAHVALTNLDDRLYHHSSHSHGYDIWANGLTVKADYDFDEMKWDVSYPRLAEEIHELRFYWHSKLVTSTLQIDAVEAKRPRVE